MTYTEDSTMLTLDERYTSTPEGERFERELA